MTQKILSSLLLFGTLCACAQNRTKTVDIHTRETAALYTPNPEVPKEIVIWGERLPIDRVDLFERLDRELTAMTYTHGNTLLAMKRANKYFPEILPILRKNGVPEDMAYLAVIESNLDNRALSPAKAAGIWQFMAGTGKDYGLEVNDFVDERYNLKKATEAACKYLKDAYSRYHDWNTVAASYNAGLARISKELEQQQQDSALDLYLVTETSRYPFRIMAMKLIMENPTDYGFYLRPDQLYNPMKYTEVTVDRPVEDWASWAKKQGISYAQLREANPWIRAKSLPNKTGKKYTVLIPTPESLKR